MNHPDSVQQRGVRREWRRLAIPSCLPCLVAIVALTNASWLRAGELYWPADDTTKIQRTGTWQRNAHRYAREPALETTEDGAALEFAFTGKGLVLCLDTLTPPNRYGPPELGRLEVFVDGSRLRTIWPRSEAGEVVILRSAERRAHRVRMVHRTDEAGAGCRIRGFRVLDAESGDLAFGISGEHNGALIDVRAIVSRDGAVARDLLLRNWLNGQARIAGLPPGDDYTLELRASGWVTWRKDGVSVTANHETQLPPVYLARAWDIPVDSFKFPAFGRAVVRRAQEGFRARFQARQAEIRGVRVVRQVGPAVISRACRFEDDAAAAYYYHREGTVTLPPDVPPGLYDLEVAIADGNATRSLVSRRCVQVVEQFSADPVFIAFGHLDTWGQEQAEYLDRIVSIANLVAPDMVLISNEANPAYAAGALHGLEMPFVINFGNHRGPEPGAWFADPVGAVDFGRAFTVVNFGRAWDTSAAEADELLAARKETRIRIVNAFEPNAPVREFLDRHRIALIHDAHGPGTTVAKLGATPTLRVGKANSESFRVIRFRNGQAVSATYRGHATAPAPFRRNAPPPVRLRYDPAGPGDATFTARWTNDLEEPFADGRAVFVVPPGNYRVEGGRRENAIASDDGRHLVYSVRFDVAAAASGVISLRRE